MVVSDQVGGVWIAKPRRSAKARSANAAVFDMP
jgi:hypothetical protein